MKETEETEKEAGRERRERCRYRGQKIREKEERESNREESTQRGGYFYIWGLIFNQFNIQLFLIKNNFNGNFS